MADWTENLPSPPWWRVLAVGEWWAHREILWFLALRDLKLRYRQTLFGVAWVVLRPLLAMGAFAVIFGKFAGLPSDGIPYAVFVLSGLAMWQFVAGATEAASESLVDNNELVEKVWFPRALAPMAAVLAATVDLAITLVLVLVVSVVALGLPTVAILTLPVWVAAGIAVAVAVGTGLAALNVLYRDVRYALPFLLQLWFFVSPVIYPSSLLDGAARTVLSLNPMTGVLNGFRWAVVDGPAPEAVDLLSLASGCCLLVAGFVYFGSVDRQMADRI